jgi:branched-chain amino acid transport system permease protein
MFERSKISLLVVLGLCAALSPLMANLNPYYYDILLSIGISIILAVGLNLVNGYTGQFSLGHAGFMAVGAYLASAMTLGVKFSYYDLPTIEASWRLLYQIIAYPCACILNVLMWIHNQAVVGVHALPSWAMFLAALLYGGLCAALSGFTVGVPSLRLRGDYLAIVTLGFNEIIRVLLQNSEQDTLGGATGKAGIPLETNFFWTFAFAALTVFVVLNLVHSTYGRGFLAVRDDEVAAEAMGINTTKYKVLAFVIAAFFAGIAGGLYAHFKQFITPEGFGFMKSIDVVVMVILGGMGNTIGVCIAAVLLTILPEGLRKVAKMEWLPDWLQQVAENRMILYSLLLIILMLLRPQGLFTWRTKPKGLPVK